MNLHKPEKICITECLWDFTDWCVYLSIKDKVLIEWIVTIDATGFLWST